MQNTNSTPVAEKKPSKNNILGILSVVFAGIALIGSWIPFLNVISIVIGFAAVIMGIISLIFVVLKKTTVLALPIIGISVSVISLILAFGVNVWFFNAANNGDLNGIFSQNNSNTKEVVVTSKDSKVNKVGETVALSNHKLTVMSVKRNYNTGNSYLKPSSGNEFIKVSVKLENETDSDINVNPYDFKVQDGSGNAGFPKSATYNLDDKFDVSQLAPGASKMGSMVFEVPKGDQNLTLIYKLSSLVNKQIEIKL